MSGRFSEMPAYGTFEAPQIHWKANIQEWFSARRGLFPEIYTLATFALFSAPVVAGLKLAMDPNVTFWVGNRAWCVLLVPALLLIAHMAHAGAQKPVLPGIVLSSIVPAIIILVVGYDQQVNLEQLVYGLAPPDTFPSDFDDPLIKLSNNLQDAFSAAESLFDDCVVFLASEGQKSEAQLRASLVLQDCSAYLWDAPVSRELWARKVALGEQLQAEQQKWATEWNYLRTLESTEGCAGWHTSKGKQTLWSAELPRTGDPCLVAARFALEINRRVTYRLVALGLSFLIITFLVFISVQPKNFQKAMDSVKNFEGF